jgi:hypothetical protein
MRVIILSILSVILLTGSSHPLYLSNTVIKYEEDSKSLNVRVQIFESDIAEIMMIAHGIDIMNNGDKPELQKFVDEYIWYNLKIKVDGKEMTGAKFVKRSRNFDALVYEYQVSGVLSAPKKINVSATFLMELFEDQTNIVTLTVGKRKKTFPLKEFNTDAEFII